MWPVPGLPEMRITVYPSVSWHLSSERCSSGLCIVKRPGRIHLRSDIAVVLGFFCGVSARAMISCFGIFEKPRPVPEKNCCGQFIGNDSVDSYQQSVGRVWPRSALKFRCIQIVG
jgi:hypothetical protein